MMTYVIIFCQTLIVYCMMYFFVKLCGRLAIWTLRSHRVKRKLQGCLLRPMDAPRVTLIRNNIPYYYFPPDPLDIPKHGTLAYDKGYALLDNPYPKWRGIALRRWDKQWKEGYGSFLESRGFTLPAEDYDYA